MDNIKVIEDRFNNSMKNFNSITAKYLPKLESIASKNDLPKLELKSFEDFLKM